MGNRTSVEDAGAAVDFIKDDPFSLHAGSKDEHGAVTEESAWDRIICCSAENEKYDAGTRGRKAFAGPVTLTGLLNLEYAQARRLNSASPCIPAPDTRHPCMLLTRASRLLQDTMQKRAWQADLMHDFAFAVDVRATRESLSL